MRMAVSTSSLKHDRFQEAQGLGEIALARGPDSQAGDRNTRALPRNTAEPDDSRLGINSYKYCRGESAGEQQGFRTLLTLFDEFRFRTRIPLHTCERHWCNPRRCFRDSHRSNV